MDISKIDTVVFSGGGVRGLSYLGVLLAFEDVYKISVGKHFSVFAGTSVGALLALTSALDIKVDICLEIFKKIGIQNIFLKDPSWLLSNFALNSGEALEAIVVALLETSNLNHNITFSEFFAKTKKHLIVTVIDMMTASTLYIDHTNEGRDMPVVKGIMGSMALPPIFPAVSYKIDTKQYLFIDGGLTDNFPLSCFEKEKTLGIRTNWYVDSSNPMQDISNYYTRVLSILQLTTHSMMTSVSNDYPNNVYIDVGMIRADSPEVNVQEIIFAGYRTSIARFSNQTNSSPCDMPMKYNTGQATILPKYFERFEKI